MSVRPVIIHFLPANLHSSTVWKVEAMIPRYPAFLAAGLLLIAWPVSTSARIMPICSSNMQEMFS
jgi:hypothetical protein